MNPQSARLRFRLRTLEHGALVLLIFLPFAFLAPTVPFGWIIIVAVICVLYYLFFYVLPNRAISIECPHCGKHIETNTPWVCGFCSRKNENADEFPFVHKCAHCGAEPKAYKCHHRSCGKLIFLSQDELEVNFARCLNVSVEEDTSEKEKEIQRHLREKQAVEHELVMTDLQAKLDASKRRRELEKARSPKERLAKSFEDHHTTAMGALEIALEKRKEVNEKYKDDHRMLRAAHEAIDDWLRREA